MNNISFSFHSLKPQNKEMTPLQAFWIITLSLISILFFMLLPNYFYGNIFGLDISSSELQVKQLAPCDIYVRNGFSYIDEEATLQAQTEAANAINPYFEFNLSATQKDIQSIESLRDIIQKEQVSESELVSLLIALPSSETLSTVQGVIALDTDERKVLANELSLYADKVLTQGYFSAAEVNNLRDEGKKAISIEGNFSNFLQTVDLDVSKNEDISTLLTEETLSSYLTLSGATHVELLNKLLIATMRPNVSFNSSKTSLDMIQAYKSIDPIVVTIPQGQRILHKDAIVTQQDINLLKELENHNMHYDRFQSISNLIFLILVTYAAYCFYWTMDDKNQRKTVIVLLYLALLTFSEFLILILLYFTSKYGISHWEPFLPLALGTIFMAHTMDLKRYGVLFAGQLSIYCMMIPSANWLTFMYFFTSSVGCIWILKMFGSRKEKVISIIQVILWYIALTLMFYFLQNISFQEIYISLIAATLNIILCYGLSMIAMPFIDGALNLPTIFRLTELESLQTPLLEKLKITAQGTYMHSLGVSELAYNAARAIGANAPLCKVAGLYHDVGKIDHPDYFIENQNGVNKHDFLKPQMSVAIIRSHVKLGVEKGREAGLPLEVINLIEQHHGNDLIFYFYNEALKEQEETGNLVAYGDYSYNAPIPSSKESAILMLADSAEAACKSLKMVTPNAIQKMIKRVVKGKVDKGLLDLSHIDLTELHIIEASLIKSITGRSHTRISYPGDEDLEK